MKKNKWISVFLFLCAMVFLVFSFSGFALEGSAVGTNVGIGFKEVEKGEPTPVPEPPYTDNNLEGGSIGNSSADTGKKLPSTGEIFEGISFFIGMALLILMVLQGIIKRLVVKNTTMEVTI